MFKEQFSETRKPRRLCNGMKLLIPDHDYELYLGGTAKTRHSENSGLSQ